MGITLGNNKNLVLSSVALIKDVEKERVKPSSYFSKLEAEHDIDNEINFEDEIDPDTSTIS